MCRKWSTGCPIYRWSPHWHLSSSLPSDPAPYHGWSLPNYFRKGHGRAQWPLPFLSIGWRISLSELVFRAYRYALCSLYAHNTHNDTKQSSKLPATESPMPCFYFYLQTALENYTFLPFSVFLAIFWIFTYKKVPETKNKTFEEILAIFRHGRYVSFCL